MIVKGIVWSKYPELSAFKTSQRGSKLDKISTIFQKCQSFYFLFFVKLENKKIKKKQEKQTKGGTVEGAGGVSGDVLISLSFTYNNTLPICSKLT